MRLISRNGIPISFVEKVEFKELIEILAPNYKVPYRRKIVKMIGEEFKAELEEIKKAITKYYGSINVIIDFWTPKKKKCSFLGVIIQFMDDQWEMKSYLISMRSVKNSHTSTNIYREVVEVLERFNLAKVVKNKDNVITKIRSSGVHVIVSDNAPNMVGARKLMVESKLFVQQYGCYVHQYQTVLRNALFNKQIKLFETVRNIVRHFKMSVPAYQYLRDYNKSHNINAKSLVMDVQTRWNSTFYMIQSVLENRKGIHDYLENNNDRAPKSIQKGLNTVQIAVLNELTALLMHFERYSTKLSSESKPTINHVIPSMFMIIRKLNRTKLKKLETINLRQLMIKEIKCVFSVKNTNQFHYCEELLIAWLLDPRFKNRKYVPVYVQNNAVAALIRRYNVAKQRFASTKISDTNSTEVSYEYYSDDSTDETGDIGSQNNNMNNENNNNHYNLEVDQYMKVKSYSSNTDLIAWWNNNKNRFPVLYMMALKVFVVPASSASIERAFSTSGFIYNTKRNRMSPELVESISIIHKKSIRKKTNKNIKVETKQKLTQEKKMTTVIFKKEK